MIIILIIAAIISFVIACLEGELKEFFEPILILLIVVINAIMGVMQESKAEKALDALKNLSAPHARVIRNGKEEIIDAANLVPGDIIKLETGDFVPADARILASASLKCEESALTGESVPSEKDAFAEIKGNVALGERTNMVFSGCSITYGTAKAVVTATGMNTEMGKIANLLNNEDDVQTPLQKKLAQLGKYLGILAGGQTLAFMVLSISQVIQSFNMRSDYSLLKIGIFSNKKLNGAAMISIGLVLLVMFTPARIAFGLELLSAKLYLIGLGLIVVPVIIMELSKLIKSLKQNR